MNINDYLQVFLYILVILISVKPIGEFIYRVFTNKKTFINFLIEPIENTIYKLSGINKDNEMNWKEYCISLLIFNFCGFIILFFILKFQFYLPLNPEKTSNLSWDLSLNTSISFITNTNWQAYSGEVALSYFSQMIGLGVQNFLSAGTGIAVIIAICRSLSNKLSNKIGNFWVDLTKSILYILIPLSLILSILLISQGVIQNFNYYDSVSNLEGFNQKIPQGPAASQIAIKQIGTNGGGFFGVNSAHPFENPTPLSNFLQLISILLIPASLTYTYGRLCKNIKHGWCVFSVMLILFISFLSISLYYEYSHNPITNITASMEGKEFRFGITNSILWSVATTSASNGSVNSMHDSLSPVSGGIALLNIMIGEIIFGGVGAGLYGMFIFIILTVFISGLMVGRTPEYLGKKVDSFDIKMAIIGMLLPSTIILVFSSIALLNENALSSLNNKGPHGLSQILYAFSSASGNNGSAFAGLSANTVFYNLMLGLAMLIGRFGVIIPVLAIAGNMVKKNISLNSEGSFTTDSILFVFLLLSVILVLGALTFFPAIILGPISEQILMYKNISF